MRVFRIILFMLGVLLPAVEAQMPHQVLLLVNGQSQDSMKVANTYAATRGIPSKNLVYLDIPEAEYGGTATVSPETFSRLIWNPVQETLRARDMEEQILAWVYSVDFPIRVRTDSNDRRQMSVCGLTFVRNRPPGSSLIEEGKYLSKLFAGPNERLELRLNGLSLGMLKKGVGIAVDVPPGAERIQTGLGEKMPLPSMMLGYTGENGNEVETVLKTIKRGALSDGRGRRDGIYFVQSDDVRSTCREWQFYPAVNELQQRGITAQVTTNFPAGREQVMGILCGVESVDPGQIASFAPGAMADHLTSWSAEFQKPQTKLTRWLEAGATGSAGAVVEPYSNPNKFPSARFYAHYAAGCTMLESFYQSIACPLQLLLLGDPLAKPYAPPIGTDLLGADTLDSDFTFVAKSSSRLRNADYIYAFLLDGRLVQDFSDAHSIHLQLLNLSDGYHELQVVAAVKHLVQFSGSDIKPFTVNRLGRSVAVRPPIRKIGRYEHAIDVEIGGQELPEHVRLVSGGRTLDEKPYDEEVELILDELTLGEGPNRLQVAAVYADGMEVFSEPLRLSITFSAAAAE